MSFITKIGFQRLLFPLCGREGFIAEDEGLTTLEEITAKYPREALIAALNDLESRRIPAAKLVLDHGTIRAYPRDDFPFDPRIPCVQVTDYATPTN